MAADLTRIYCSGSPERRLASFGLLNGSDDHGGACGVLGFSEGCSVLAADEPQPSVNDGLPRRNSLRGRSRTVRSLQS